MSTVVNGVELKRLRRRFIYNGAELPDTSPVNGPLKDPRDVLREYADRFPELGNAQVVLRPDGPDGSKETETARLEVWDFQMGVPTKVAAAPTTGRPSSGGKVETYDVKRSVGTKG